MPSPSMLAERWFFFYPGESSAESLLSTGLKAGERKIKGFAAGRASHNILLILVETDASFLLWEARPAANK